MQIPERQTESNLAVNQLITHRVTLFVMETWNDTHTTMQAHTHTLKRKWGTACVLLSGLNLSIFAWFCTPLCMPVFINVVEICFSHVSQPLFFADPHSLRHVFWNGSSLRPAPLGGQLDEIWAECLTVNGVFTSLISSMLSSVRRC